MKAIRTRMIARDTTEQHRTSSPLELLFDLTFVVAIASLVGQLAHAVVGGHVGEAIGPFLMVFFAIWWAWNQFAWIASAWDNDDALYRVFTLVQMGGVLVLAAGVPTAFAAQDFTAITLGYLIMRLGLLGTLLRVVIEDPASRPTALRYLIGISVVQVGWLLRLAFMPPELIVQGFVVLAAAEMLVSPWADRTGELAWHPHHIAERYGLFVIILLGESVLAVTVAVQEALADGVTSPLVIVATAGLVLLFTLWWLYFSEPAAEGLVHHREGAYLWGYGHYFVFASLAAVGAGLEVAVDGIVHVSKSSDVVTGFVLAVPVSIFLLLLWLLHSPIVERVSIPPGATVVAVVLIMLAPLLSPVLGMVVVTVAITLVTVLLLLFALFVMRGGSHDVA